MKRVLSVCLAVCLFISVSSLHARKHIAISLRGGLYAPASSTINNDFFPAMNMMFTELSASFVPYDLSTEVGQPENMTSLSSYGLGLEFFLTSRLSVALSGEFLRKPAAGFSKVSGTIQEIPCQIDMNYDMTLSVAPIIGTVKYRFLDRKWIGYVGLGIGYYRAQLADNWGMRMKFGDYYDYSETMERQAEGNAVIPSINAGFGLAVSKTIAIVFDVKYAFGSINSFKVTESSTGTEEIGRELTFFDIEGKEVPIRWELNGFDFGLSLEIAF